MRNVTAASERPPTAPDPTESRYAWVIAGVALVLVGLNFGALGSIAVFLKPLAAEFHSARGSTAFGYSAAALAIGVAGIGWGALADRRGPRMVVLVGVAIQALALSLLSRVESLAQFYAGYVLLGGLGFAAVNVPMIATVGLWFTRSKGLALGMVSAGGALGQGLVPLVASSLINSSGWRAAYVALAAAYIAVGVPLALLVRPATQRAHHVEPSAERGDYPLRPAAVVAWLSAATVFCCVTMAVPVVHTVALLTDRGLADREAVRVFVVVMASGVFGRVLLGRLSDRLGGLRSYLVASLLQTALVFWFTQLRSPALLYILAALFGIGYSGVMTAI